MTNAFDTSPNKGERRVTIADWTTAIMSIFWSVWWGFFMGKVMESPKLTNIVILPKILGSIKIILSKEVYLAANAIVVAVFAYNYVIWLWNVRKFTYYKSFYFKYLLKNSNSFLFALILLLGNIGFIGLAFQVPKALITYGLVLSIIWPIVVLIILWKG